MRTNRLRCWKDQRKKNVPSCEHHACSCRSVLSAGCSTYCRSEECSCTTLPPSLGTKPWMYRQGSNNSQGLVLSRAPSAVTSAAGPRKQAQQETTQKPLGGTCKMPPCPQICKTQAQTAVHSCSFPALTMAIFLLRKDTLTTPEQGRLDLLLPPSVTLKAQLRNSCSYSGASPSPS